VGGLSDAEALRRLRRDPEAIVSRTSIQLRPTGRSCGRPRRALSVPAGGACSSSPPRLQPACSWAASPSPRWAKAGSWESKSITWPR